MRPYYQRIVLMLVILVAGWACLSLNTCTGNPSHAAAEFPDSGHAPLASAVPNGTPLPDTGQTQSYTTTFGEDSDYLINPPSYTKLDANGNDLPDSATEWVMVRDNVTGLIWEVKTDDGSIHDKDNTYNWQDVQDVFIAAVNAAAFGGHSDWHVPTIAELSTILDLGGYGPAIDTDYFPNTASSYWSSTTDANYTDDAWFVDFGYGIDHRHGKSNNDYVRAVRGGQTGSLDHLVINGDGTVTDTVTGLMWQQATDGLMAWEIAVSHCEGLSLAGYGDWRLPNKRETHSVVDYSEYGPAIDTSVFPDTESFHYWSSTSDAELTFGAWTVIFLWGCGSWVDKSFDGYVRAVRGGQTWVLDHLFIFSPRQGSRWQAGDSMPITWDTQGISGDVEIAISRQGGKAGTFETIAAATENDGGYDWVVSGPGSVNCMLRIVPLSDPSKGTTQGLFSVTASVGAARYVKGDGVCNGHQPCYSSIQGAIDAAGDGDTILVQQGNYDEAIILNEANSLKLLCGRDTSYNPSALFSTANALQIRKGRLIVEGLSLCGE